MGDAGGTATLARRGAATGRAPSRTSALRASVSSCMRIAAWAAASRRGLRETQVTRRGRCPAGSSASASSMPASWDRAACAGGTPEAVPHSTSANSPTPASERVRVTLAAASRWTSAP